MENIIRCSACGKSIIAEEEFIHKCRFDVIDIPVSDFFIVKKGDHESVIAKGLNGKSYRFVKRLLNRPLSDEKKHEELSNQSDEDETEPKIGFPQRL